MAKAPTGWHGQSLRHSNARRFGKAGGSYSIVSGEHDAKDPNRTRVLDKLNKEQNKNNSFENISNKDLDKAVEDDFIDRLMRYEDGKMNLKEQTAFLKEVESKGLGNKLQGHYGRAIANMKANDQPQSNYSSTKTLRGSNKAVAKAFVDGKKAKSRNTFTEGDAIYSYGKHFPMAVRLKDGSYLVNKDKYSSSTSRQQSYVRQALSGKRTREGDTAELLHALGVNRYEAGTRGEAWGSRPNRINTRLAELQQNSYPKLEDIKEKQSTMKALKRSYY